ncbi:MAG: GNAT family N-acetyltransferase [Planctomycetota bacterium]|jgi:RimJ/RimL family protein N-acetyltransferase
MNVDVRRLDLHDVDRYVEHFARCNAESGVDGLPHFHVYGRSEPYDPAGAVIRARRRWSTPLDQPGWRRAWGLFDDERIVGHAYLEGGSLPAEMHRAQLGMGVQRSHHRQGGGRRLLDVAVDWARGEPGIEWIDLGVFVENAPALDLYASVGFVEQGRTADRYRVDGHRIEEIAMSLHVGARS